MVTTDILCTIFMENEEMGFQFGGTIGGGREGMVAGGSVLRQIYTWTDSKKWNDVE